MTAPGFGPPYRAVWVLVDGVELPGLELLRSTLAVTVRYVLPGQGRGTAVDTVTPDRVRPFRMYSTGGGHLE